MTQQSNALEDVAKRENWIDFGAALGQAMNNPSHYGLRSANEVLQDVARIRGKRAHSLKNSVTASAWLKDKNPEIFGQRPAWLGMTLVLFLMKIEELDTKVAENIAARVFSGQSSQIELKQTYDELREKRKTATAAAGGIELSASQRARVFNDVVSNYLERFGTEFFNSKTINIQPGRIIDPISPDLVVTLDGEKRVAVEVKSYRNRVDRHLVVNTLGYLALIQKLVPEILMIVPEDSAYDLNKMIELRDKLSLSGIRFATMPEREASSADDLKVLE